MLNFLFTPRLSYWEYTVVTVSSLLLFTDNDISIVWPILILIFGVVIQVLIAEWADWKFRKNNEE
jgi:hypothetical protein